MKRQIAGLLALFSLAAAPAQAQHAGGETFEKVNGLLKVMLESVIYGDDLITEARLEFPLEENRFTDTEDTYMFRGVTTVNRTAWQTEGDSTLTLQLQARMARIESEGRAYATGTVGGRIELRTDVLALVHHAAAEYAERHKIDPDHQSDRLLGYLLDELKAVSSIREFRTLVILMKNAALAAGEESYGDQIRRRDQHLRIEQRAREAARRAREAGDEQAAADYLVQAEEAEADAKYHARMARETRSNIDAIARVQTRFNEEDGFLTVFYRNKDAENVDDRLMDGLLELNSVVLVVGENRTYLEAEVALHTEDRFDLTWEDYQRHKAEFLMQLDMLVENDDMRDGITGFLRGYKELVKSIVTGEDHPFLD